MNKLYKRNEILFAVAWILFYCLLTVPVRGELGDGSPWMTLSLSLIAALITLFVRRSGLTEKYGLKAWPKRTKVFLYFIPMWVLATGNVWDGFELQYSGVNQLCAVTSMLLIGYVEEMLFRGFLFKALIPKDGIKLAVIISALTFGIGHMVNLLSGQASLETVLQVFFAISWGFIFTFVFYKSGSLWPCIIAHGLVDAFSMFGKESRVGDMAYVIATIVFGAAYCVYLARVKTPEAEN